MEDLVLRKKYEIKVILEIDSDVQEGEDDIISEESNFIGKLIFYKSKYEEEHIYPFCSMTYVSKNTYCKFEVIQSFDDLIRGKYVNLLHKHRHERAENQINDDVYLIGFDDNKKEFDTFTYFDNVQIKEIMV